MQSDRYLKRVYNTFNKKYFKNQLPKITVRFDTPKTFCKQHGKKTCAVTNFDEHTDAPVEIIIRRDPHKHWSYIKLDLLHEMAHVALPFGIEHGPRFKAEMRRLEEAGAFRKFL